MEPLFREAFRDTVSEKFGKSSELSPRARKYAAAGMLASVGIAIGIGVTIATELEEAHKAMEDKRAALQETLVNDAEAHIEGFDSLQGQARSPVFLRLVDEENMTVRLEDGTICHFQYRPASAEEAKITDSGTCPPKGDS